MISDENLEESKVELKVYQVYLKYYGGWKVIILANLSMAGFMSFRILNDYWVGNWALAPDQHSNFYWYFWFSLIFALMTSVCVFFRTFIVLTFSWFATRNLHKDMIKKILNAPINLYFDVTPIGRILNKFSKDLSAVESFLAY